MYSVVWTLAENAEHSISLNVPLFAIADVEFSANVQCKDRKHCGWLLVCCIPSVLHFAIVICYQKLTLTTNTWIAFIIKPEEQIAYTTHALESRSANKWILQINGIIWFCGILGIIYLLGRTLKQILNKDK